MAAEKEITETKRMPMIAMRGIVLFPNMILHFDVGRKKSIAVDSRLPISTTIHSITTASPKLLYCSGIML